MLQSSAPQEPNLPQTVRICMCEAGMFIVLRPCDGFPDVSSVALTFVLFVWRCLPIGVSVLTLSLKSGEGMRILSVATSRI